MSVRPLIRGILSFVPVAGSLFARSPGQTDSAEYCYAVWLKHLCMLHHHGLKETPNTVAELGPGESVGVGLAALLSGAEHYVGLDVAHYTVAERNVRILDELVELFRSRAPRPQRFKGWPDFDEYLDAALFPSHILTPSVLERTLAKDRVARIRDALLGRGEPSAQPTIRYVVPWSDPSVLEPGSVDLVLSHSVLEHVVDLEGTYRALSAWLKPGGWTSHQVDLKSHGMTREWNGYRAYSEPMWKLMLGRRPYLINRHPCSVHLQWMEQAGLETVIALKHHRHDGIPRERAAPRWRTLSDDDFTCSGLYVIARKRAAASSLN